MAGWRDVGAVVKASVLRRLGKPLLRWYAVLLVIGVIVVGASVFVMHCE
jgi:hypothetical protein